MNTSLPQKPKKKNRLYDLLREAGFDVSDWSNYKRSESPASNPKKRKRLVAGIYGVEALTSDQAKDAVKAFRDKGWFETMKREIRAIDGYDNALETTEWAPHILNVRYRLENVDHYPEDSYLPDSDWLKDRHRYMLYHLDASTAKSIERSITSRRGSSDLPETKRLFRRGTKPVEYTPEHDKMQAKLMHELVAEYGEAAVTREQDYVDLRVETETERIYFEIKTDLSARAVLRQALGQILEYAYYPGRNGPKPDKLIIVGRSPLDEADRDYLEELRKRFLLPLHYRIVEI